MSSKLNRLSLIAALAVAAGTSAAVYAAPTEAEVAALESGNPHSVDFALRDSGSRPATKDDLQALESDNPHSVDFAKRTISSHRPTNEELRALETGNPDAVRSR